MPSLLKISCYFINLFVSVPCSLIISQVVSLKTQIYTQSPSTDLTRGHDLCSGGWPSMECNPVLVTRVESALIRSLLLTIHAMLLFHVSLEGTYFSPLLLQIKMKTWEATLLKGYASKRTFFFCLSYPLLCCYSPMPHTRQWLRSRDLFDYGSGR